MLYTEILAHNEQFAETREQTHKLEAAFTARYHHLVRELVKRTDEFAAMKGVSVVLRGSTLDKLLLVGNIDIDNPLSKITGKRNLDEARFYHAVEPGWSGEATGHSLAPDLSHQPVPGAIDIVIETSSQSILQELYQELAQVLELEQQQLELPLPQRGCSRCMAAGRTACSLHTRTIRTDLQHIVAEDNPDLALIYFHLQLDIANPHHAQPVLHRLDTLSISTVPDCDLRAAGRCSNLDALAAPILVQQEKPLGEKIVEAWPESGIWVDLPEVPEVAFIPESVLSTAEQQCAQAEQELQEQGALTDETARNILNFVEIVVRHIRKYCTLLEDEAGIGYPLRYDTENAQLANLLLKRIGTVMQYSREDLDVVRREKNTGDLEVAAERNPLVFLQALREYGVFHVLRLRTLYDSFFAEDDLFEQLLEVVRREQADKFFADQGVRNVALAFQELLIALTGSGNHSIDQRIFEDKLALLR